MKKTIDISKIVKKNELYEYLFSICTLVTRKQEYEEMLESFLQKGFTTDCCEYMHIDNSESCTYDAYQGLNVFLQKAKGKYVILCHQDIIIHDNDKDYLLKLIEEVNNKDKNWAVLGNAGGVNLKWIATHITQLSGRIITEKDAPLRVYTVDENFIVVKKSANLALSANLNGFHFYGTDICLIADVLGFSSYFIKFNLTHKSNGNTDKNFFKILKQLKSKYKKAFRNRYITTTFSRFYLSGNYTYYLFNTKPILFLVRQYYKFFTKRKDYKLK